MNGKNPGVIWAGMAICIDVILPAGSYSEESIPKDFKGFIYPFEGLLSIDGDRLRGAN